MSVNSCKECPWCKVTENSAGKIFRIYCEEYAKEKKDFQPCSLSIAGLLDLGKGKMNKTDIPKTDIVKTEEEKAEEAIRQKIKDLEKEKNQLISQLLNADLKRKNDALVPFVGKYYYRQFSLPDRYYNPMHAYYFRFDAVHMGYLQGVEIELEDNAFKNIRALFQYADMNGLVEITPDVFNQLANQIISKLKLPTPVK